MRIAFWTLTGLSTALILILILILACCSTLPDWSPRESREFQVLVDYGLQDPGPVGPPSPYVLPVSNEHLMIFEMQIAPEEAKERFSGGVRWLYPPSRAESLQVRCHYRLYRRFDAKGRPLPWPRARELFPGARRIRFGGSPQEDGSGQER